MLCAQVTPKAAPEESPMAKELRTILEALVIAQTVFKNSLSGCSGSGSAVLAIGSGSGFRVYPILDPSPTPKNPNPEIYPDEIFFKDFSVFRGGIA